MPPAQPGAPSQPGYDAQAGYTPPPAQAQPGYGAQTGYTPPPAQAQPGYGAQTGYAPPPAPPAYDLPQSVRMPTLQVDEYDGTPAPSPYSYSQPGAQTSQPENLYARPANQYSQPGYQPPPLADPYYRTVSTGGPPSGNKSGLWWKIAVPVIVVIMAAAAVYYFFFLRNPNNIIVSALKNVGEEASQRLDGTPLRAIKLLEDTINDGTLTVSFEYEDRWWNDEVSGKVSLASKMEQRDFALSGDLSVYGQRYDFEAFLNSERVALGSKLIDNKYYGFKFSTFRDDMRVLGDLFGIDRRTLNEMADAVEMIEKALAKPDKKKDDKYLAEYAKLLQDFYKNIEQTSENTEIDSGGKSVKCKKIDFVITKDAMVGLLNDFADLLENDESIREQFDLIYGDLLTNMYYRYSYNDLMNEYKSAVRRIDRGLDRSSKITFTLYIGSKDRLLSMGMDADLSSDGDRLRIRATMDFGASATDRWTLNIRVTGDVVNQTVNIVWDIKERSNSIENSISVTVQNETITLMSSWSPARGDFTLSVEDKYGDGGKLTGVFLPTKDGFSLEIDNPLPSYRDQYLTLKIEAKTGASIKKIDYVNLDKWDKNLKDKLEDLMYSGIFFGF